MRTDPLSSCELQFFKESIKIGQRLDGRGREEFRETKLVVGAECGTAMCTIGDTKVLCAVSASIYEPSQGRPNKGVIAIEVDMSPMANPSHEHDRLGHKGMELTRLLELVIRDSRCIDVESLCIRSGKEVWKVRVDVRILDEDGSLLDCASVAVIAALQHFRRPNVTLEPHQTIIHSKWEKAPVPLNIYHMPVCVTFGYIEDGSVLLVDPTDKETQCLSGSLIIACNKRREVCALHQSTKFTLSLNMLDHCVRLAMKRAEKVSDMVLDVIREDSRQRSAYKEPDGFAVTVPSQLLNYGRCNQHSLKPPTQMVKIEDATTDFGTSDISSNNLLRENAVNMEDAEDDALLAIQVDAIQKDVQSVDMNQTTAQVKVEARTSVSSRKREVEEVNDLLDGLDDLEDGEVATFEMETDEGEADLLKAKKKKK